MELEHSFVVPVPVKRAWDVLLDVQRVAPCMPGATLDSVDGDEIRGKVKVKVGPISMTYAGTARFTEKDAEAGVMTLEASGRETKGSGTAAASVRSVLADEGDQTRVTVLTTLNVTGRPAQFGRGVMADVSGRLLAVFAANLADMLAASGQDGAESGAADSGTAGQPAGLGAAGSAGLPVGDLQLAARTAGHLRAGGVRTAGELAAKSEQQLLDIAGIGPASVRDIRARLAVHGLQLGEPLAGPAGTGAAGEAAHAGPGAPQLPPAAQATAPAAAATTPATSATTPGTSVTTPAAAATAAASDRDNSLNLFRVAAIPVLKRALPVLAALAAAAAIALRKRLARGRRPGRKAR